MQSRAPFLLPLISPRYSQQCARVLLSRSLGGAAFHSSARLYQGDSNFPNHYEALELEPNASLADIKRQFYALSKLHHPDLARSHPSPTTSDPSAPSPSATRFHQISEAYRVLAHADSRHRYDRDYHRIFPSSHSHHSRHSHHTPYGSHSSHTAHGTSHAGSRPASGLSRRRAQFRGPPPSFYQQGRYGGNTAGSSGGTSRRTAAQREARAREDAARASRAEGDGVDDEVPHFDRAEHRRRQEGVASTQSRSRRARGEGLGPDWVEAEKGGDGLFNFLLVGGIVVLIAAVPSVLASRGRRKGKREGDREGKG